jgi:hypothetical protein
MLGITLGHKKIQGAFGLHRRNYCSSIIFDAVKDSTMRGDETSVVADLHHFDADANPDPIHHFDSGCIS